MHWMPQEPTKEHLNCNGGERSEKAFQEFPVGQVAKDLVWSLVWCKFDAALRLSACHGHSKKKKKERKKDKEEDFQSNWDMM